MSAAAVLDASAVLAYLDRESGHELVSKALAETAAISTVNLAAVHSRVAARGLDISIAHGWLSALGLEPEAFTDADARCVGSLYPDTVRHGLSLGDRACLALGVRLGLPVLTANRAWASLAVGVDVRVLR